jgi:hypothetical protein
MVEPPINIHIHDALGQKDRERLLKILKREMTTVQFNTPDITPTQIVAFATAAVQTAVVFGVHLSAAKQHILIADAGLLAAFVFGDSIIRHGRATGNANKS